MVWETRPQTKTSFSLGKRDAALAEPTYAVEAIGGRGRDRTGDPLLAKRHKKIYLIGSLGFVLCPSTRFFTSFGTYRTQLGLKKLGPKLDPNRICNRIR